MGGIPSLFDFDRKQNCKRKIPTKIPDYFSPLHLHSYLLIDKSTLFLVFAVECLILYSSYCLSKKIQRSSTVNSMVNTRFITPSCVLLHFITFTFQFPATKHSAFLRLLILDLISHPASQRPETNDDGIADKQRQP